MTVMRWNNRKAFIGYTPKEIKNMATAGNLVGIYNGLVYDVTGYVKYPPGLAASGNQTSPAVSTQFMHDSVIDIFT